jgi:hypothetical protein
MGMELEFVFLIVIFSCVFAFPFMMCVSYPFRLVLKLRKQKVRLVEHHTFATHLHLFWFIER